MEIKKIRDLTLVNIDEERTMVIACDSCGGIGMNPSDVLKVPPFIVGRFTVRVALLEVMCSGAEVITVTDAVCNEMEPTASEIIKGIQEELRLADISNIVLTGSTEENFTTYATGLGVTVIGIAPKRTLKVNRAEEEALVVSIGLPKVGNEIDFNKDAEIVDYEMIKALLKEEQVYEIVPVGSKGIAFEVEQLAANNNLTPCYEEELKIDLKKSGGPATCVIAAIDAEIFGRIKGISGNVNLIGKLASKEKTGVKIYA